MLAYDLLFYFFLFFLFFYGTKYDSSEARFHTFNIAFPLYSYGRRKDSGERGELLSCYCWFSLMLSFFFFFIFPRI
jgi:hypothetical protein